MSIKTLAKTIRRVNAFYQVHGKQDVPEHGQMVIADIEAAVELAEQKKTKKVEKKVAKKAKK